MQLAKDAGFDGIELNYDLENDLSPKAGTKEFQAIRKMADKIGISISGICSFLFWPYPLTSNDSDKRARGVELAGKMTQAAHDLGVENLLVVPGAVHIPWRTDHEPVPNDVCDKRARSAISTLLPQAEKLGVSLNIENIFFNGYLMTPMEMVAFVDGFQSDHVRVHFDTGNIMMFQFPEHWISVIGKRIKNVHFKEYTKKGTDFSLESFRPLLDGTTDWPAVMEALDQSGYRGYLTFEYFHPYLHYPEALVHQTSDSLERSFASNGRIRMDLSAGDYRIAGTQSDRIRLEWSVRGADQLSHVKVDATVRGAKLLCELLDDFTDVERKVQAIKEVEHQGDAIAHRAFERLHRQFITPFDRAEIHRLLGRIDDVLDLTDATAERLLLYEVGAVPQAAKDLARVLVRRALEEAGA